MIRRCDEKNSEKNPRYGGRGIEVCDEWKADFRTFESWAKSHGYRDDLSIDRINNDGNYCPENCRWADEIIQQNNKSNNHIVEYNGKKYTVAELARAVDSPVGLGTIYSRLRNGWSVEKAFSEPPRRNNVKEDNL